MNYEEALKELKYDNEERDWDNCMFDMAGGVYEKCIEALEKQIPKKPRGVRDFGHTHIFYYVCPTCEQVVYEMFDSYCSQCGQKLTDWNEVE